MSFLDHLGGSDEAEMIRASAERFTAATDDAALRSCDGFDMARWRDMADLGWHGVLAPQATGGLGLGASEMSILARAAGHARLPEPFIASSVTALTALREAGGAAGLMEQAVAGTAILAPSGFGAPASAEHRFEVTATDTGMHLAGEAAICEIAPATTDLLIFAAGGPEDMLVHLLRDAVGIQITPFRGIDGRHLATLRLRDVPVSANAVLARGCAARAIAERAGAFAIAALCADAVGCMDRALTLTATYLNERRQFDRPLATFQALRHRFADIGVEVELARSMAELAGFAAQSVAVPAPLLDRARARICRAAQDVGQATIQLHGGMGMTDEMAIGHYFRRLICIQALLGQEAGSLRARATDLAAEIAADAEREDVQ